MDPRQSYRIWTLAVTQSCEVEEAATIYMFLFNDLLLFTLTTDWTGNVSPRLFTGKDRADSILPEETQFL